MNLYLDDFNYSVYLKAIYQSGCFYCATYVGDWKIFGLLLLKFKENIFEENCLK